MSGLSAGVADDVRTGSRCSAWRTSGETLWLMQGAVVRRWCDRIRGRWIQKTDGRIMVTRAGVEVRVEIELRLQNALIRFGFKHHLDELVRCVGIAVENFLQETGA